MDNAVFLLSRLQNNNNNKKKEEEEFHIRRLRRLRQLSLFEREIDATKELADSLLTSSSLPENWRLGSITTAVLLYASVAILNDTESMMSLGWMFFSGHGQEVLQNLSGLCSDCFPELLSLFYCVIYCL